MSAHGDDVITGTSGDDFIAAGEGNDTIHGLAGNDVLFGWTGNDFIDGGEGDDMIDGWEGHDVIYGLAGNDTLFGWSADDLIDGGEGDDWIFGEGGADILAGGAGNDVFGEYDQWHNGDTITDFSIGDLILIRDADIATFTFSLDGTTLTFGGAQTSFYSGGTMTLSGAAGAVLVASEHPEGGVQIIMTVSPVAMPDGGNNSQTGTMESDTISGDARNDLIVGLLGNDTLTGAAGSDRLFGGAGDDILSAGGAISFDNGATVDELYGGAGNDMIFAGFGDIVDGGDGFDTVGLSYMAATTGITGDTETLHNGQSLVAGGGTFLSIERFSDIELTEFNDKMVIGDQHDPATVRSGNGDDHLIGQEFSITMYGGNGNDLLVGGTGDDIIYGESGNDKLIGHFGLDQLWGGEGSDTFYVTTADATDWILDFQVGVDRLDVTGIDADRLTTGDQAFSFIGQTEFTGKAGELRVYQDASQYFVAGDVNGDGSADLLINLGSVQVGSEDLIL